MWVNVFACDSSSNDFWCGTGDQCSSINGSIFPYPAGAETYTLAGNKDFASQNATPTTANETANATVSAETTTVTAGECASESGTGSSQHATIGVGVGVGVPLALAAAVFAALWLQERKGRKSAEERYNDGVARAATAYAHRLPEESSKNAASQSTAHGYPAHGMAEAPRQYQPQPTELAGEMEISELGNNKTPTR